MSSADDARGDRSANDAFWEAKIAEAEAAGGSIEMDLADIPPVPGAVVTLPSVRAGGGKHLTFEGDGGVFRLTVGPLA